MPCISAQVITSRGPSYFYNSIIFVRSNRGRKIFTPMYKTLLFKGQFLVYTLSLWKTIPRLENMGNTSTFKKEFYCNDSIKCYNFVFT